MPIIQPMSSWANNYRKMKGPTYSCHFDFIVKVFLAVIVLLLLIQTFPLRNWLTNDLDGKMRFIEKVSKNDSNCHVMKGRMKMRHNLERQLHANLMEFNDFLMNGQTNQQYGSRERKTHDQIVRVLAISQQLMTRGEEEENGGNADQILPLPKLSAYIQSALESMQNPSDCGKARLLLLKWHSPDKCGLGCMMHIISFALTIAAASNRTLVFDEESMGWIGWDAIFEPFTMCKFNASNLNITKKATTLEELYKYYTGPNQSERIVLMPSRWHYGGFRDILHMPPVVPSEYAELLNAQHSNGAAWFCGQFIQYLWKPKAQTLAQLKWAEEATNLTEAAGPIVGIHVRRTDKINEAKYHPLEDYMKQASNWFDVEDHIAGKQLKRRLFVATDDPGVLDEVQNKWGKLWEISAFEHNSQARSIDSRYTYTGIQYAMQDIHVLARCQFVVCTFSSNVSVHSANKLCRFVYEMMQSLHGDDASTRVRSLDTYYDDWSYDHRMEVTEDYSAQAETGEISANCGDIIAISDVYWNGIIRGKNMRTAQSGLFPSYLLKEHFKYASFPIFQGFNESNKS